MSSKPFSMDIVNINVIPVRLCFTKCVKRVVRCYKPLDLFRYNGMLCDIEEVVKKEILCKSKMYYNTFK